MTTERSRRRRPGNRTGNRTGRGRHWAPCEAGGERVPDIMRRTGLTREQVRLALRAAGARPGADKCYAAADVERALGAFRRGTGKRRYRACPPGEERLSEAAARTGVAETTVQRALRAAGVEPRGECYPIAGVDRALARRNERRALARQRARLSLGKRVARKEVGAEMGSSLQEDWAQEQALAKLEGRQAERREFINRYVPYNERLPFSEYHDPGRYRGKSSKKSSLDEIE